MNPLPETSEQPFWRPAPPVPPPHPGGRHARNLPDDQGHPPGVKITQRTRYGRAEQPWWQAWWVWVVGLIAVCVIMGNLSKTFAPAPQIIVPGSSSCNPSGDRPPPAATTTTTQPGG